MSSSKTGTIHK